MHQVAVRGMAFKMVPVQGLGPDLVITMNVPQLDGQQPVRRPAPDGYGQ